MHCWAATKLHTEKVYKRAPIFGKKIRNCLKFFLKIKIATIWKNFLENLKEIKNEVQVVFIPLMKTTLSAITAIV